MAATLIARFKFDGNLSEESSKIVATINGQTASYAAGPSGLQTNALSFNGAGSISLAYYASIDFTGSTDFSYGGWIYLSSYPSSYSFLMANTATWRGLECQFTPTYTMSEMWGDSGIGQRGITSGPKLALSTWTHYWTTYTASSRTEQLYINGISAGTVAVATGSLATSTAWTFGRAPRSAQYYTGRIADVRFYSGVQSPTSLMVAPISISTLTSTNCSDWGIANGTLNLTATGGYSSLSYKWNDGKTTASRTGVSPGSYSCTITDASTPVQTLTSSTVTITEPTGSGTASSRTNLGTGSYTLKLRDANAIDSSTYTYTVGTKPAVTITPGTVSNASSQAGTNGSISTTTVAGGGSYTYAWSDSTSATTASRTGLGVGQYILTVTEAQGNTGTYSYKVSSPIVVTGGSITNVTATGQTNGSIAAATVSGGYTPFTYTYSWSDDVNITTITRSSLATGTYVLTVTDVLGVTSTCSYTIGVKPQVILTVGTVTNVTGAATNTNGAIASTTVSGGGIYSYAWSDGAVVTNGNTARSNLAAGTYILTVNEAQGNTASVTYNVYAGITITPGTITKPSNSTTANGAISSASYVGGLGPYTYSWSNGSAGFLNLSNILIGTYALTVRDSANVTQTYTYTVVAKPQVTITVGAITNATSFGGNSGSIAAPTVAGSGVYTYSWADSAVTTSSRSSLYAGTYTLTVTEAEGNTASTAYIVKSPFGYTSTTSSVSYAGSKDGKITVYPNYGTGPYVFSFSGQAYTSSTVFTALSGGTYIIIGKDAADATYTVNITVYEPAGITLTPGSVTNCSYYGASNGSIGAPGVSGGLTPYYYLWENGTTTTSSRTGLVVGTYTLTVRDAWSYTASHTYTLTEPTMMAISSLTSTAASYYDVTNGSTSLSVVGGVTPYTYLWSNGSTSQNLTNILPGSYTVSVTDSGKPHVVTSSITISSPIIVTTTATITACSYYGIADGSISVSVSGGISPYTYTWNGSSSTASSRTSLSSGSYTVNVKDTYNRTFSTTFTVSQPSALSIATTGVTHVSYYDYADGKITPAVTGGTQPYTYSWDNGSTEAERTSLTPGTYSVTATETTGRTSAQSYTITQPGPLYATVVVTDCSYYGKYNGSIVVTAHDGSGIYTYYPWITGKASSLSPGSYTVTVGDGVNSIPYTYTITQPDEFVCTSQSKTDCTAYNAEDGSVTCSFSGGLTPYSYAWTNGITNASLTNISAGTYALVATDAYGTNISLVFTITEPKQEVLVSSIGPIYSTVSWTTDANALYYRVSYKVHGSSTETIFKDNYTQTSCQLINLSMNTEYDVIVYVCQGSNSSVYKELGQTIFTTTDTMAVSNTAFSSGTSSYSLSSFTTAALEAISSKYNVLFTTGDTVTVTTTYKGSKSTTKTRFVQTYDTISLSTSSTSVFGVSEAVSLPFTSSDADAQSVTITGSSTTLEVTFDEVTGLITVNGVSYDIGDVFEWDGMVVSVSGF